MGALIELKNIGYSYHNLAGETGAIKDVSFSGGGRGICRFSRSQRLR